MKNTPEIRQMASDLMQQFDHKSLLEAKKEIEKDGSPIDSLEPILALKPTKAAIAVGAMVGTSQLKTILKVNKVNK